MKKALLFIIILGVLMPLLSCSSTEKGSSPPEGQDIQQTGSMDEKQSRYARLVSSEWSMDEIIGYYDDNKVVFQTIVADLLEIDTPDGLSFYLTEDDSIFLRTLVETPAPIELSASAEAISDQMQALDVLSIQKGREDRIIFVITEGIEQSNYEQGLLYDPDLSLTQMEKHIDGDWYWYSIPHT